MWLGRNCCRKELKIIVMSCEKNNMGMLIMTGDPVNTEFISACVQRNTNTALLKRARKWDENGRYMRRQVHYEKYGKMAINCSNLARNWCFVDDFFFHFSQFTIFALIICFSLFRNYTIALFLVILAKRSPSA